MIVKMHEIHPRPSVLRTETIGPEPWGIVKTSVLGVASFGILPLLVWPGRFRAFSVEESRHFRAVADWARQRGREPAAIGPLRAAADGVQTRPLLWLLPILLALFVAGVYLLDFFNLTSYSLDQLLDATYGRDHIAFVRYYLHQPWSAWPIEERMHFIWCAGLSAAFLCHWAQIRLHATDVGRFVARFNAMTEGHFQLPIPLPRVCISVMNPALIVAAVAFLHYGVWWGIPMLLAGTTQRSYISSTSRRTRSAIAQRIRLMESEGTVEAGAGSRCGQAGCQAVLPAHAVFCPRCGARVASN